MNNRNKALIITSAIMIVVATVCFLVGGFLAGWDFAAYFRSNAFIWLCVLVGLYVVAVGVVVVKDRIGKL